MKGNIKWCHPACYAPGTDPAVQAAVVAAVPGVQAVAALVPVVQ